jgi:hypothetical protein
VTVGGKVISRARQPGRMRIGPNPGGKSDCSTFIDPLPVFAGGTAPLRDAALLGQGPLLQEAYGTLGRLRSTCSSRQRAPGTLSAVAP